MGRRDAAGRLLAERLIMIEPHTINAHQRCSDARKPFAENKLFHLFGRTPQVHDLQKGAIIGGALF
jgi:hypothetical protein